MPTAVVESLVLNLRLYACSSCGKKRCSLFHIERPLIESIARPINIFRVVRVG